CDDVLDGLRDDDPDRDLPVVGAAGRVERAVARGETHLAADVAAQLALELLPVEALARTRRRAEAGVGLGGDHVGHAAYLSASARFSSRPRPGRPRSGRSTPPSGSGTPSNSNASTRT